MAVRLAVSGYSAKRTINTHALQSVVGVLCPLASYLPPHASLRALRIALMGDETEVTGANSSRGQNDPYSPASRWLAPPPPSASSSFSAPSTTYDLYDPYQEYDKKAQSSGYESYVLDRLDDAHYRPRTRQKNGFYSYFEKTDWNGIVMHTIFCFVAYPFLIALCALASDRSIFWARVIVGGGCGVLGYALAFYPYRFATRYLEAGSTLVFHFSSITAKRASFSMGDFYKRRRFKERWDSNSRPRCSHVRPQGCIVRSSVDLQKVKSAR